MSNPNDSTSSFYDIVSAPIKGREITDAEIALISSIIPSNSNVLDIGTGTGRHLIPLSELGYNVTGIDSSNGMLDVLEKKIQANTKAQIIRANVLSYDFKNSNFDLIILMWNAFNEIALDLKSSQLLFNLFNKILVTGGKVLINSNNPEVTNMNSSNYKLDYFKDNKDYQVEWKAKEINNPENITTYEEKITVAGQQFQTEIKQKWWTEKEYKRLSEEYGFKFENLEFKMNNELYIVLTKI